ncbi:MULTISPECIES: putative bifunctional diguanylate cyclase/phosphodiesterase [Psychrobacter]|uniref:putative bifunctional diguanylate cyclase/phosphodiesterase n=1 Tax=Psychrobacter TaxID=497 RepID=UPI0008693027|nr:MULTISPECIES: GGDEF domain-containing phosphodiesterase [Psychrobacter]MBA6243140.1 EAL domain-containing protein [Psychrobacter sp. Urea-trap-18]MBA6286198.1 EAL domain-containing protein [Psychrobacter sp. Urea-trap-16]MBA6317347.1 EAL domain-containing protein [Psychrobacter sp. Urea-trap-20]MBA6334625.1 EAL domain-containing protein [Psychrobacter sp. Urea-trap-19]OEH68097.1 MAG: diguanylate cyclase [Psychrobacter sp. B29-1]|tara:strand:+ start:717 stop:2429 length:1713 start_codon:yes stop_codon:yes gene_type:complete
MSNFDTIPVSIKQQLMSTLCEQLEDAIFILDENLRYLSVNASYELLIGYKEEFLVGRPLGIYAAEFLSEEEQVILKDIKKNLNEHGFYELDFSMANRYGQNIDCHITYRRIYIDQMSYHIGMLRDMSAVIKDQKQVAHLLNYDQLTGLPNRKVFLSQTSDMLLDSYQEVVLVRLNIDRYRNLASLLGPDGANDLIKNFVEEVEKLKLHNLRSFSHFGGDDFALLFEVKDANMVRHQLDTLMQMCERPFSTDKSHATDANIYYHISVGVSCFPKDDNEVTGLLTKAEKALDYVKQHGGDDIRWYDEAIESATAGSLELESELRTATIEGQFVPYYQPKFSLETGAITGFEALVRWQHPTRGLLKPVHFINAIIAHKLSFDLFSQLAIKIVKQLAIWQQQGFHQHVCINADAAEFSHPDFFDMVSTLLTENDVAAHQLHIEVTESSLIQRHDNVKKQLNSLRELGVRLALDDFGTGYASLSYLQEYPFDFIKIDKSFISNIETDRTQHAIVKAILDLAVALDMQVVAEGIETEQQRDVLLDMGCKIGQGYWFSKPVAADVATEMLIKQNASE